MALWKLHNIPGNTLKSEASRMIECNTLQTMDCARQSKLNSALLVFCEKHHGSLNVCLHDVFVLLMMLRQSFKKS